MAKRKYTWASRTRFANNLYNVLIPPLLFFTPSPSRATPTFIRRLEFFRRATSVAFYYAITLIQKFRTKRSSFPPMRISLIFVGLADKLAPMPKRRRPDTRNTEAPADTDGIIGTHRHAHAQSVTVNVCLLVQEYDTFSMSEK